jgi:hypothetical protein
VLAVYYQPFYRVNLTRYNIKEPISWEEEVMLKIKNIDKLSPKQIISHYFDFFQNPEDIMVRS